VYERGAANEFGISPGLRNNGGVRSEIVRKPVTGDLKKLDDPAGDADVESRDGEGLNIWSRSGASWWAERLEPYKCQ
jgi:hypothetical protein